MASHHKGGVGIDGDVVLLLPPGVLAQNEAGDPQQYEAVAVGSSSGARRYTYVDT